MAAWSTNSPDHGTHFGISCPVPEKAAASTVENFSDDQSDGEVLTLLVETTIFRDSISMHRVNSR